MVENKSDKIDILRDLIIEKVKKYNKEVGIYINYLNGNILEYNSEIIFESASCIKLFILFEYYRQIQEGLKQKSDMLTYEKRHFSEGGGILKLLDLGVTLKSSDLVKLMIDISDNVATNILIEYLGMDNIQKNISALGFHNTKIINDFHFPSENPVGYITAKEYGEAFKRIINCELYNEVICKEMLEILKKQKYKDILTKKISPEYKNNPKILKYVASKSGKKAGTVIKGNKYNIVNDGGIISTKFGDYVIAICINQKTNKDYFENDDLINLAADLSTDVFLNFIKTNREDKNV